MVVVEKKTFPREKTCGDGLTPRAVTQLRAMGLEEKIAANHHRYDGLRCIAHGVTLEMPWPEHPVHPSHGYVVRRRDLDTLVAAEAEARGATLRQGTEALRPVLRDGLLAGAVVKDVASGEETELLARYVVIADGSLSRFGRALGNQRDKRLPQGMAIRGYFESPMHADPWIESALDVRDRNGDAMPGYGWIFPCGDGTINVGIGLLSTFRGWREINTSHLMKEWAATAPEHWGIDPDAMLGPATGGRLPMAGLHPPEVRPELDRRGRRRRVDQPVQRRGHRLRLRDGPHGRRPDRRGAGHRHGAAADPLPRPARGRVRPLLPRCRAPSPTSSASRR